MTRLPLYSEDRQSRQAVAYKLTDHSLRQLQPAIGNSRFGNQSLATCFADSLQDFVPKLLGSGQAILHALLVEPYSLDLGHND